MKTNQLAFLLQDLRFSAGMPPEVLRQFAAQSTVRHVTGGAILFREGEITRDLYLVQDGLLALEMKVPGRGNVRLLTVGPGEMVGWSSLLDEGTMTTSAVAIEESELIVASAERLRQLCEQNHEFGYHLMRRMAAALSKRLVATRLQLLDLFADTAWDDPGGESGVTS